MQKWHTLQGAPPSEPRVRETESGDSGTRLKRADKLDEPPAQLPTTTKVVEISLPPALPEPQATGRPPRWLAPIALTLGVVCLALACWLQVH